MAKDYSEARWYISSNDGIETTISDASDPTEDGDGVVCWGATPDDAQLIVTGPALLKGKAELLDVAETLLAMAQQPHSDCVWASDTECRAEQYGDGNPGEHSGLRLAEAVIKKGKQPSWWFECASGDHHCYNDDQVCGCRCDECIDLTEPRCNTCNQVLEHGLCPDCEQEE